MKKNMIAMTLTMLLGTSTLLFAGHPEIDRLIEQAMQESGEMEPKELKQMLDAGKALIVLDVREREQRAEGEIYADDYYAITRGNLEFEVLNKIKNKETLIVTYCRGGSRGALAAQTLRKLGYKNALNLKGGLKGWAKAGYAIDTGLGVTRLAEE